VRTDFKEVVIDAQLSGTEQQAPLLSEFALDRPEQS
jgi:hypothetical protein